MTISELYQGVYTWIVAAIDDGSIPIIQTHQNAPAPTGTYIAISYAPTFFNAFGRHAQLPTTETAGEGELNQRQDEVATMEIWEVNGNGDTLRQITQSIETDAIQELLHAQKISVLSMGDIQRLPRIEGDKEWVRECMMEVEIATAYELTSDIELIEDVEITNNIL